ncbi:MAG: hypothetical protein NC397_02565 [Clostridium sp.]|nr:hypothetical protein [Clostridium sp.]
MNTEYIIRHNIEKLGSMVEIKDEDWKSMPFKALITPLWRKKSSNFEAQYTELGESKSEYFLYIGPANHNITALSDRAMLLCGERIYEFKHSDRREIHDEVLYYTGILRLLKGVDRNAL